MPAGGRVDAGHLVAVLLAVLQIVDARQFGDHVFEGRMRRDVVDPHAVDPDLAAVPEAVDVAPAGHRAERLACGADRLGEYGCHLFATLRAGRTDQVSLPRRALLWSAARRKPPGGNAMKLAVGSLILASGFAFSLLGAA